MAEMVIFTDLDGTLLDHKSYSVRAALPAIDLLNRRGLSVIPVSSKTAQEIRRWIKLLNLEGTFISENGCGIYIPIGALAVQPGDSVEHEGEWVIRLGMDIGAVRAGLKDLSREAGFSYRTFDQMSGDELSVLTGLAGDELEQCLAREFDLPFIINGEYDPENIGRMASDKGFYFTRGGRFNHLTGGCHKGKAVSRLVDIYRQEKADPFIVGIGDSYNDVPMFEAVDLAFLVQKPDGTYDPLVPENTARRVHGTGPGGWRAAIEEVMILG